MDKFQVLYLHKKNSFPKYKINETKFEIAYLTKPQGFSLTLNEYGVPMRC